MNVRPMLLAALAATLLLVGGCGTATGDRAPAGSGTGVHAVDLDFTATTVDGESFDGEQLAGKPAVLWFWAPWCPTCHGQTPMVGTLAEKYDGQVSVVGVGGLDSATAIGDYADKVSEAVTLLVDEEGAVWRHFEVTAQSTYVVLDADGNLVVDGYLDDDALAEHVANLVD